jgi:hypothetical protein
MPEFVDRKDGQWLSISDGGLVVISAHRGSRSENALTVYWRGRSEAAGLGQFFGNSLPPTEDGSASALLFTPTDRIRLDRLTAAEFREKLPNDATILRLEFLARRRQQDAYDPVFIVWSRLGLAMIPKGQPAPDDIGVFLAPSHMGEIKSQLSEFIMHTHIYPLGQGTIRDCLDELGRRIGG